MPFPFVSDNTKNIASTQATQSSQTVEVQDLRILRVGSNTEYDLLGEGTPITGQTLETGGSTGMGWLSSIRKAITDLSAKLPSALVGGRLDVNIGSSGITFTATPQRGTAAAPAAVSVTTTATLVLAANANRKGAWLHNNSSQTIYVGPTSGVTTSNGMPVAANTPWFDEVGTSAWYAIVAASTADVRAMEWS